MGLFKATSPELRQLIKALVDHCRQHDEQVLTELEIGKKGFVSGGPNKGLVVCIYAKAEAIDDIIDYACQRLGIEADKSKGEHW